MFSRIRGLGDSSAAPSAVAQQSPAATAVSPTPAAAAAAADDATSAAASPPRPRHMGTLYVAPLSDPASQTCVFLSCHASVQPSTAEPFLHEWRISSDEPPETENEHFPADILFPIDGAANYQVDGPHISWNDRAGKKRYTLDIDNEQDTRILRKRLARALYEQKHSKTADAASDVELENIFYPKPTDLLSAAGELLRLRAELYNYDTENDRFTIMVPNVLVTLNSAVAKEDRSRAYLFMIFNAETENRIMEDEIGNEMAAKFYATTLSMIWVISVDPDAQLDAIKEGEFDPNAQLCLSLKFASVDDFVRMKNQFGVALYEVNNQATMDSLKINDTDRDYIIRSLDEEFEAMELDNEPDYTPEEEEEFTSRTLEDDVRERRTSLQSSDGHTNSQLAVAYNNDRTFVVRGDRLGVLSHASNEGVEHKTTVVLNDPTKKDKTFIPSHVLLHEKDTSMLMLDKNDPTRVMKMDLERGQVVSSWDGGLTSNMPVTALQRTEKYSNLTHNPEFLGINKNALFRMDPRTKEFIVQSKKYASGTRARLDAVATTGAGYIATASENGDIRLFDAVGKNAKTHLPGLGDRIIGVDVTEDGNFVLATTEKYLLVIDTRVKGEAKGGFQKSMGQNKPKPIKLTIKPEDQAKHRMGDIRFTTAHFNTGSSLERSIVTSTGPFIVTWNFRSIKQGKKDAYQIKRYLDTVVADDFAYNNDGKIVVTLPHDVTLNRMTPHRQRRPSETRR